MNLKHLKCLAMITLMMLPANIKAQGFNTASTQQRWDANWIMVPGSEQERSGVYLFRKSIELAGKPESFQIYVSADNRYKLYVNEVLVSLGPALGDIKHWNYETVDIAAYLKAGKNVVSAKVWNEGDLKAVSQFSYRTGFILQGAKDDTKILNTNASWKCIRDNSYTPLRQTVRGYYAAGAGERIDMQFQVKDWEKISFDDSSWKQAAPIVIARSDTRNSWNMVPSILPQMEMTVQRLVKLRKAEGVTVPTSFPSVKAPVTVPANSTSSILLDQTFYTNAYPTLNFSGGKNSKIIITYSEGLYDAKGAKHNRNEIDGKTISGRRDTIISDGTANQNFTSLNYRTYRYVELKVETKESPLVIEDFYGTFTGYPFKLNAKIEAGNADISKIFEIGWRTARSCAVETYMDCPYYERLQYIGDARIQLFVSYYNSGDDRLAKNALNLMSYSRQLDGYTLSRYPDTQDQIIPTYSLWYITMLYDYLMYGSDPDFVTNKLLGTRQILNYFISYQVADGSLKNVPGWNFTDWVPAWQRGTGPIGKDGSSSLMDLQLLHALQAAVKLEEAKGSKEYAVFYNDLASKLIQTIKIKYWDSSRKLFADTPEKDKFSQHTNSLAILAGIVKGPEATSIGRAMLSDTTLAPSSIYFKYYLHLALSEAGLGDDYLSWLDIWRKNIELGLTTWGETSEVESTRSDCHAWGASPNIEFFRTILGITSDSPNFRTVKIEPHPGTLKNISGEMPHPSGIISVKYTLLGSNLNAEINLPDKITGTFIWKGKTQNLSAGKNLLKL
jgi:hypothetical protein